MLVENYSVGWRRYTLLCDAWASFMKINGVSRQRAYACLALVLLVKVEVLKPLSSSRRLDKGELPGVRSLSSYRLAGGQTASRRVASVREDMWCGRDQTVSPLYYHLPVESPGPHGKGDRHPNGLMVRAHRGLNSREWRPPGGISLGATWWEWS